MPRGSLWWPGRWGRPGRWGWPGRWGRPSGCDAEAAVSWPPWGIPRASTRSPGKACRTGGPGGLLTCEHISHMKRPSRQSWHQTDRRCLGAKRESGEGTPQTGPGDLGRSEREPTCNWSGECSPPAWRAVRGWLVGRQVQSQRLGGAQGWRSSIGGEQSVSLTGRKGD